MTDRLSDLEARLARLEAVEQIKVLKARYLRACDLKQPDAMLETFVPEGAIIAYEGFPSFSDRESFVAIFREMGCQPGVFDIHHATNAEIAFDGADSATGLWSLHFQSINLAMRTVTQFGLEYADRYVRQGGRWLIAETRSTRTSCLIQQIDESGAPSVVALGEAPAVYGELP